MRARGQLSLEVLATYGWAMLLIAVAITFIWYSGYFKPSVIPEGSAGSWGLVPSHFRYHSSGSFILHLRNDLGYSVRLVNATLRLGGVEKVASLPPEPLGPGSRTLLSFSVPETRPGQSYEALVRVVYNLTQLNATFSSSARLWGSITP